MSWSHWAQTYRISLRFKGFCWRIKPGTFGTYFCKLEKNQRRFVCTEQVAILFFPLTQYRQCPEPPLLEYNTKLEKLTLILLRKRRNNQRHFVFYRIYREKTKFLRAIVSLANFRILEGGLKTLILFTLPQVDSSLVHTFSYVLNQFVAQIWHNTLCLLDNTFFYVKNINIQRNFQWKPRLVSE